MSPCGLLSHNELNLEVPKTPYIAAVLHWTLHRAVFSTRIFFLCLTRTRQHRSWRQNPVKNLSTLLTSLLRIIHIQDGSTHRIGNNARAICFVPLLCAKAIDLSYWLCTSARLRCLHGQYTGDTTAVCTVCHSYPIRRRQVERLLSVFVRYLYVQSGSVITRYNITWYCIHHCSDWGRI